jgi:hypothetical protein
MVQLETVDRTQRYIGRWKSRVNFSEGLGCPKNAVFIRILLLMHSCSGKLIRQRIMHFSSQTISKVKGLILCSRALEITFDFA